MRPISTALAALASLAAVAHAADERAYDVAGFTKVSASSGVDVVIAVGGGFAASATVRKGDIDKVVVEVKGDTLHVSIDRGRRWNMGGGYYDVTVDVSMPALVGVDVSSGSDLTATGVDAERFSADVRSGSDAELSGTCGRLVADVSSGADLEAKDLKCRVVEADASSGADAEVYASEKVVADASSGADIDVWGGPREIESDESSGGDVTVRG